MLQVSLNGGLPTASRPPRSRSYRLLAARSSPPFTICLRWASGSSNRCRSQRRSQLVRPSMALEGRTTHSSLTQPCAPTRPPPLTRPSPQIAPGGRLLQLSVRESAVVARTHHKLTTKPSRGGRWRRATACSSHGASRTRTGDLLGAMQGRTFAPVRVCSLNGSATGNLPPVTERLRTRANAERCHCCHAVITAGRPVRRTGDDAFRPRENGRPRRRVEGDLTRGAKKKAVSLR
jgi:hypothetical protein